MKYLLAGTMFNVWLLNLCNFQFRGFT